jgi:THO complex subunit 4
MSAKLDKSLDEILSSRRQNARRGSRRRDQKSSKAHGATTTAPVGGVKKATKHAKPATKVMPTGPSTASGESKIIVSGLVSYPLFYVRTFRPQAEHPLTFSSLPMSMKRISRYVDRQAFWVSIAVCV